jgi:Helix-loop-helix DNA-binding domain.
MTRLPSIANLNRDLLQTWINNTLDTQSNETTLKQPIRKRRSTKSKNAGTDEQTLLKKDVYWQTSKPVDFENMDISSLLYSETFYEKDDFVNDLLSNDLNLCPIKEELMTSSDFCLDQTFPLQQEQHEQHQLPSQSLFTRESSSTSSAFDTYSSTSDDSIGSFESVEEAYKMPPPPHQWASPSSPTKKLQQQQNEQSSRKDGPQPRRTGKARRKPSTNTDTTRKHKIDPVYNSDPYLQRHRLMVNARQKNRMMKINNMYTMLNTLLPDHVICEQNVKPHSKLGILKRAIAYWESLNTALMTPGDENKNENSFTSATNTFTEQETTRPDDTMNVTTE